MSLEHSGAEREGSGTINPQADNKRSREVSDAKLVLGIDGDDSDGATYDEHGLKLTDDQMKEAYREMNKEIEPGTEETKILEQYGKAVFQLFILLGFRYMHKNNRGLEIPPGESLADTGFTARRQRELCRMLSITEPTSKDEGIELRGEVFELHTYLNSISHQLVEHPNLRIGATVSVRRTNGAVESGWKITTITPRGRFVVTNESVGSKTIPFEDLAEVNPTGWE